MVEPGQRLKVYRVFLLRGAVLMRCKERFTWPNVRIRLSVVYCCLFCLRAALNRNNGPAFIVQWDAEEKLEDLLGGLVTWGEQSV